MQKLSIQSIHNDDDPRAAFTRLETIFQVPENTPEADELDVLVSLTNPAKTHITP